MSVSVTTVEHREQLSQADGLSVRLALREELIAISVYLHISNSEAWFLDRVLDLAEAGPGNVFSQGAGENFDNPGDLTVEQAQDIVDVFDSMTAEDIRALVADADDTADADEQIDGGVELLGDALNVLRHARERGGLSVR